ncbi:riboflavin biosynthesis protein RibD [Streptomyces tateyamensis]|uniref:Riboflavin biosynthesis protein RibD n=1 Tax=Streptomyces tateyamensis TaxID=565073 RepID=A0A2V4NV08_9ACTN|nr:dihydrofolate reductase family protein [Streptomyces tateyamensis]PYC85346.1 riboflavin biosynthesis protein RibD [Streptomyces tateyamensis]
MSVIVIQYISLDGIVSDPTGTEGTARGGWLFRYGRGPELAGDAFRIAPVLRQGVLLLGRRTWQGFAGLWPDRTGEFADVMNGARKLVASRTLTELPEWANSDLLAGDPVEAVKRADRDVVVMGSLPLARELAAADLVDEYRLITLPTVLGTGEPLFPPGGPYQELALLESEPIGHSLYTRYGRAAG